MATRSTLKTWFQSLKKPTAAQFSELFDSYFHKTEDNIPVNKVEGLADVIGSKADAVATASAISNEVAARQAGDTSLSGTLNNHVTNLANPHQVSLEQVRAKSNQIAGNIDANNNSIINLRDAVDRKEPLTKGQFDDAFNSVGRGRGPIDCSTNPNYPASNAGDRWEVSVAGKIGGASGKAVELYDEIVCLNTTAAGTDAAVGGNFYILQGNMVRATESTTGFSQVATTADAEAMTNDDKFVTPLKAAALVNKIKKAVNYQVNVIGLNEVSIYMELAGQVNNVLVSGCSGVKLKIGTGGTYPAGAQTYPFPYAAGDTIYITYNYSNLADARCNVKLKCQDN